VAGVEAAGCLGLVEVFELLRWGVGAPRNLASARIVGDRVEFPVFVGGEDEGLSRTIGEEMPAGRALSPDVLVRAELAPPRARAGIGGQARRAANVVGRDGDMLARESMYPAARSSCRCRRRCWPAADASWRSAAGAGLAGYRGADIPPDRHDGAAVLAGVFLRALIAGGKRCCGALPVAGAAHLDRRARFRWAGSRSGGRARLRNLTGASPGCIRPADSGGYGVPFAGIARARRGDIPSGTGRFSTTAE